MSPADTITILVADDHPVFRRGMRDIIDEHDGFSVVGESSNGREALRTIKEKEPDVAILDLEMPVLSGLDVAARLQKERTATSIIFLTAHDNESLFRRAMDLGAAGYILKDTAANEIVRAIEMVLRGDYYISPALSSLLLKSSSRFDGPVDARTGISLLTATERRVLHLIARERSTSEIAEELSISSRTVDRHRANMNRKLGLSGSYALVRFALTHRNIL